MAALKAEGCHVIEGGRFVHVSDDCNKGTALKSLTGYLSNKENKPFRTLAIGDGKNDIAMLEAADVALLIPSPVQPFPIIKKDRHLYHAQAFAADGWQEGVTRILQNTET